MRLFWHELRTQQLMFWRNRESAVFIFIFPPMLFLLLGAVYDGKIDGVPAVDRLLVGIMGYGCANTALAEGRELEGLEVRRPTLEDVYLDLVDDEPSPTDGA